MIQVDSYLRGSDGAFLPIAAVTSSPVDSRYVEGALTSTTLSL
jgi:hypothetical protein